MKRVLVVAALALFLSLSGCGQKESGPYPTDQALMDRFQAEETLFVSLLSDPADPKIRAQLGVIDAQSYGGESPVHTFIVWKKDLMGPGGYYKGYHYSETEPPKLVDSIDEIYNSRSAEQVEVCRPIEGPWYLYYSSSN